MCGRYSEREWLVRILDRKHRTYLGALYENTAYPGVIGQRECNALSRVVPPSLSVPFGGLEGSFLLLWLL